MDAGISETEILNKLGDPASLAHSFIGTNLLKDSSFNLKQILKMIAFYAKTGFSGMVIIPILSILSATLYICSFFVVIIGAAATVTAAFGIELPISIINLGFWSVPQILSFPITALFGIGFYLLSNYLWRKLKQYLAQVSKQHQKMAQG